MTAIIKPIITEKSMREVARNRYSFLVEKSQDKHQIRDQIEKLFGVKVIAIQTLSQKGKSKRNPKNRRLMIKPNSKKAIVQLAKGQKIDLFDTSSQPAPQPSQQK